MRNIIYISLLSILIYSCDTNERNIIKTFNRLNSNETSAASKYIWPKDHKNLYTFEQRFLANKDLVSLDVESIDKLEIDGNNSYQVNLKCNNCNDEILSYFKLKKNLVTNNKIIDTFFVKSSNGIDYITFDWGLNDKSQSENLKLSSILTEKINLRAGPGLQFDVVYKLGNGDEIITDADYKNSKWRKGIIFDNEGGINNVYFSSKLSDQKEINFFTINWANSMGIVIITLIAIFVLFVVYPLLFSALFRMGGQGAGTFAIILFLVLLIAVYFTYQIIEIAIFELFIVNLPF